MLYSNPITCSFPNTVHQWFSSPCSLWGAKVWISLSHSVRRLQPTWLHHWWPPVRVIYPGVRVVWPHSLLSTPCPFHSCCSFRNPLSWPLTVCTRAGSTLDSKEESRQGSSSCRKLGWSPRYYKQNWQVRQLLTAPCSLKDSPSRALLVFRDQWSLEFGLLPVQDVSMVL